MSEHGVMTHYDFSLFPIINVLFAWSSIDSLVMEG